MSETKMYFRSFLKLNSHLKIFYLIRASNCCSTSLRRRQIKMMQKKEKEIYFALQGNHSYDNIFLTKNIFFQE